MLVTRPFRCEDCITRFFAWIWASASNSAATFIDAKSLVYSSPAAALHTDLKRHGRRRRKMYAAPSPQPQPQHQPQAQPRPQLRPQTSSFSPASIASWLRKPIHQHKSASVVQEAPPVRRVAPNPAPDFFPEIIGVIVEIKQ